MKAKCSSSPTVFWHHVLSWSGGKDFFSFSFLFPLNEHLGYRLARYLTLPTRWTANYDDTFWPTCMCQLMLIAYQHTGNLSKQILVVRWNSIHTIINFSWGSINATSRGGWGFYFKICAYLFKKKKKKIALIPGSENLGTAIFLSYVTSIYVHYFFNFSFIRTLAITFSTSYSSKITVISVSVSWFTALITKSKC